MVSLGKKILVYGLCSILGSPFMVLPSTSFAGPAPIVKETFTIYQGGKIFTMTEKDEEIKDRSFAPKTVEVVVVNDQTGRIVVAGKKDQATEYLKNDKNRVVNLGNNVMLPGFMDPHGHFIGVATNISTINLAPTPIGDIDNIPELQKRLLQKIKERDYRGQGITWVDANNYDDTMLEEMAHPSHTDISGGELADYAIQIKHISGHMIVFNTTAIRRLFEQKYITSDEFKKALGSTYEDKTVKSTQLVEDSGTVKFQVSFTDGSTAFLAGIQMVPNAVDILKKGPATVDTYLQCLSGLFVEGAMSYIVPCKAYNDKQFITSDVEKIGFVSKEYASRGVTTAIEGGTILLQTMPSYQKAIVENKLPLRVVLNPWVYGLLDSEITKTSLINHTALGWEKMVTEGSSEQRSIGTPSSTSPQTGSDITDWYVGNGVAKADWGKNAPDTTANTLYQAKVAPQDNYQYTEENPNPRYSNRLLLGTWKFVYDGSNQGYTGYFAQKGYYKLPEGNETYYPVGRTGDEAKGTAKVNNIGMISIKDNKHFIDSCNHYGSQGSFSSKAQDVFKLGMNLFEQYHGAKQSVSAHLNGSRASVDGVTFIENAVAKHKDVIDSRHCIIHAQMQELPETQRLIGNYNSYPLNDAKKLQAISTVWQGTSAMKWVKDEQVANPQYGYDPEEGHYEAVFSDEANQLRKDLNNGELMKAQNITSSYFVDHTYYWGERHRDIFMGPGSAYNMSPMGWAVVLGHRYTLHNDTPVTPQNPLMSVSVATTRLSSGYEAGGKKHDPQPIYSVGAGNTIKDISATKKYYATQLDADSKDESKMREYPFFDHRITVLQAFHALTKNSAFASKLEKDFGTIEVGKFADFVILAQDPFELEKQGEAGLLKIANIPVVATVVGGKVVFGFLPGTKAGEFVANLEVSYHNDSNNVQVSNLVESDATDAEVSLMKKEVANFYGYKKFTANVTNGKVATFTVQVMGNNAPISSLRVSKLVNTSSNGIIDYNMVTEKNNTEEGKFWITKKDLETVLTKTDIMKAGEAYYIHFTVKDGGKFDADGKENGVIEDPTFVSSSASLPVEPVVNNGGVYIPSDDGGCTVGTNPHYDFVILFVGALGLLVVRSIRRREQD